LLEKRQDVPAACLWRHVELLLERIADLCHGVRLFDQLPDAEADRIDRELKGLAVNTKQAKARREELLAKRGIFVKNIGKDELRPPNPPDAPKPGNSGTPDNPRPS